MTPTVIIQQNIEFNSHSTSWNLFAKELKIEFESIKLSFDNTLVVVLEKSTWKHRR